MNLAVYSRAAALLDCNLDVSVILWAKTSFKLLQHSKRKRKELYDYVLSQPTSVQSLRRRTVVSVGLMLIVFSSIKLFKELPPVYSERNITYDKRKTEHPAVLQEGLFEEQEYKCQMTKIQYVASVLKR